MPNANAAPRPPSTAITAAPRPSPSTSLGARRGSTRLPAEEGGEGNQQEADDGPEGAAGHRAAAQEADPLQREDEANQADDDGDGSGADHWGTPSGGGPPPPVRRTGRTRIAPAAGSSFAVGESFTQRCRRLPVFLV